MSYEIYANVGSLAGTKISTLGHALLCDYEMEQHEGVFHFTRRDGHSMSYSTLLKLIEDVPWIMTMVKTDVAYIATNDEKQTLIGFGHLDDVFDTADIGRLLSHDPDSEVEYAIESHTWDNGNIGGLADYSSPTYNLYVDLDQSLNTARSISNSLTECDYQDVADLLATQLLSSMTGIVDHEARTTVMALLKKNLNGK